MDKESIGQHIWENRVSMLRLASSILHHASDTEDAVSDAVVRAFTNADALKDETKFKPWILKITVRCCYDLLQRKKREEPRDIIELQDMQPVICTTAHGVFDRIQALPSEYRQTMLLYYHDGFKAKEIAKILDCPLSTVLMRISRGRQKLKKEYETEGMMRYDQ